MHRYKCESLDIVFAVEELSLSGEASLGRCSRSTAYRDVKRINEYLTDNKYSWRVKLFIDKNAPLPYSLVVIEEQGKNTCKDCIYFMGFGDWNLCCSKREKNQQYPSGFLCYEDTIACEFFDSKEKEDKNDGEED